MSDFDWGSLTYLLRAENPFPSPLSAFTARLWLPGDEDMDDE